MVKILILFFQDFDYSPLSTPNGLSNSVRLDRVLMSEPITPNKSRCLLLDNTPRTPTPFKKALADIEKRSGPIKQLPHTPTRLEDITEFVKKEQDLNGTYETDSSMMISVRFIIFIRVQLITRTRKTFYSFQKFSLVD